MGHAARDDEEEVSLFSLGTALLRHLWRIVCWAFFGAVLAGLTIVTKPPIYLSTASFIPKGADAARTGLAGLAGQFGVALPSGNQPLSPDFYARLLKSRELLAAIGRDTFVVPELGGRRTPFLQLFEIEGGTVRAREEDGVRELTKIVSASVAKTTGIVDLSVGTRWPSVSTAIATALVAGVNEFNLRTTQSQAAAERRFVEGRLAASGYDLRLAEDRLQEFLRANRQLGGSPELAFARDRLQRAVELQQQVFTGLTQSYQEARIREMRDMPVITIVESPSTPTQPEPSGRITRVLLGLFIGVFIGVLLAFLSEAMARQPVGENVKVDEFVRTLGEVKGEVLRWVPRRIRW